MPSINLIDNLDKMKIHEMREISIQGWEFDILRVPGGWIYYRSDCHGNKMTSNFVPEDLITQDFIEIQPRVQ
jgi:hypothetical protein